MRVVVTRIEPDGTMQRRVVDTARCSDGFPQPEQASDDPNGPGGAMTGRSALASAGAP